MIYQDMPSPRPQHARIQTPESRNTWFWFQKVIRSHYIKLATKGQYYWGIGVNATTFYTILHTSQTSEFSAFAPMSESKMETLQGVYNICTAYNHSTFAKYGNGLLSVIYQNVTSNITSDNHYTPIATCCKLISCIKHQTRSPTFFCLDYWK